MITCGIDIGSESTKVVLGPSHGCEIVRNEVGGHTTPTAISFSQRTRQIGPTASLKSALIHVNRLLEGERLDPEHDSFQVFYLFQHDADGVAKVEYDGAERTFTPAAVIAMLLGKIRASVLATMERMTSQPGESFEISYVLSVGPQTSERAQSQLLDAAYAAGMGCATIVESGLCYSHAFQRKFPEHMDGRTIMIVDMGHSQTTVSVLKLGEEQVDESLNDPLPVKAKLLSAVRHKSLGGGSVDVRLWHHFQTTKPALSSVTKKSRAGQRLLEGSKKLKHVLSRLPDGTATVENVGLAELCEPDAVALSELIQKAIQEAGVDSVSVVEAVGGGCRIPWVQSTILRALGNTPVSLSHSLDDTSVSLGAALIGEDPGELALMIGQVTDERTSLLEAEQAMATLDADMQVRADTMNKIEAHVLEMRSAKHEKHAALLPATLDSYLDGLDDWIFSEEAEQASKEAVLEKLEFILQTTNEMCHDYLAAVRKETETKEQEMEEEAKKAQLERAGEEGR